MSADTVARLYSETMSALEDVRFGYLAAMRALEEISRSGTNVDQVLFADLKASANAVIDQESRLTQSVVFDSDKEETDE